MNDAQDRLNAALGDRYRIIREAGAGGMATVYLAEDLRHRRNVALKVLRPELAATLGPDRFLREIEIAARLQHPHILPLLDSGDAAGFLYYVMPFVEGESLRGKLAHHGELPVHEAVKVLIEVADALAHAHAQKVVHRDIKPENILMSGRHALVTDFGVAKAVSEATGRHALTTAGVALGTPTYMAPEQATADPQLDERVDLYALGVLGYEMLAGRAPFVGKSVQEILAGHLTQAPQPVRTFRESCPAALDEILLKCLAKRPADRWQSAEDLLQQLTPFATPSTGITPAQMPPMARPRSRAGVVLIGAVALVALGVVGAMVLRGKSGPTLEIGRRIQVTRRAGVEYDAALSPDGKLMAYSIAASGRERIVVQQVEGGNPVEIARDTPFTQAEPVWSPDGRQIAFLSERGLEIVPSLGGTPRVLTNAPVFIGGFSPDGKEILLGTTDSVATFNLERGTLRTLAAKRETHSFSWSPDGRWVAFVAGNTTGRFHGNQYGNMGPSTVYVVPAAGGVPIAITDSTTTNASPIWLPGNRRLVYASNREGGSDAYLVQLDGNGRPGGPATRVTTGLGASWLGLSADGRTFMFAPFNERSNVYSVPIPTSGAVSVSEARAVTSGNQVIERFDVSRDGKWLVFDSDRSGNADLWRMAISGGEPEQLTRTPESEFWPSFSPDGTEILFHRAQGGRRQLYLLPSSGGKPVRITEGPEQHSQASWGSDRDMVILRQGDPAAGVQVTIKRTGSVWGAPVVLRDSLIGQAEFSPDGRFIAANYLGRAVLLDGDGRNLRQLPVTSAFATYPGWAADSRRVYYLELDRNLEAKDVVAFPIPSGPPSVVVRFDDPSRPWHRFGLVVRDGRIWFTLGERESDIWIAESVIR